MRPDADRDRIVPGVARGVLVGQGVPALWRGVRGCPAPLVFHGPVDVRRWADTERGWFHGTDALAVRARRIAKAAFRAELFGCPDPREVAR